MRHGERVDVEISDLKGCSTGKEAPIHFCAGFAEAVRGKWIGENRDRIFSAKSFQAPRVVHMFVGEKNAGEGLRRRRQFGKQGVEAFRAEACIDQNRCSFRLGKNGISRTAAGEDGDMNHELFIVIKNAPGLRVEDRRAREGLQWLCGTGRAFGYEKSSHSSQGCQ